MWNCTVGILCREATQFGVCAGNSWSIGHLRWKRQAVWGWERKTQQISVSANIINCCAHNHRITGWKRPPRSSSPTVTPAPPCLLNHVLKCHIYTFFEHLQRWGLHHLPGQPGPVPDHSFCEEIFPNIQSKPAPTRQEAIASRPVAG